MNTETLIQALEICRPGLANKEIVEFSTSFGFHAGRVLTHNSEIAIAHPVEELQLEGSIQADVLYKFLKKFTKPQEVEIRVEEDEEKQTVLLMKINRSKVSIPMVAENRIPKIEIPEESWHVIPEGLVDLMAKAVGACSRDKAQFGLTCLNVQVSGVVEASDQKRIIHGSVSTPLPVGDFLLPSDSVDIVKRIQPTQIAESSGWVHFRNDKGTQVSCHIFHPDGKTIKIVDFSKYLEIENPRNIHFPAELVNVLDRAQIFSAEEHTADEAVEITLEPKKVTVIAQSGNGKFEETSNCGYRGEPFKFGVVPGVLKDILADGKLDAEMNDTRIRFSGPNWIYITALKMIK